MTINIRLWGPLLSFVFLFAACTKHIDIRQTADTSKDIAISNDTFSLNGTVYKRGQDEYQITATMNVTNPDVGRIHSIKVVFRLYKDGKKVDSFSAQAIRATGGREYNINSYFKTSESFDNISCYVQYTYRYS
ncbi:hypothetical protein [Desulfovibrio inopinatus]|uniref:hypothetical protein n=1 Tax=Desulfovibrio inopinatus TaxID=102109 RepID=UPI00047FF5E2|nr:hypothetical protein [Desulfovibrio inopinatus]